MLLVAYYTVIRLIILLVRMLHIQILGGYLIQGYSVVLSSDLTEIHLPQDTLLLVRSIHSTHHLCIRNIYYYHILTQHFNWNGWRGRKVSFYFSDDK